MRVFSLYGFHLECKETKKTNGQQTLKEINIPEYYEKKRVQIEEKIILFNNRTLLF